MWPTRAAPVSAHPLHRMVCLLAILPSPEDKSISLMTDEIIAVSTLTSISF